MDFKKHFEFPTPLRKLESESFEKKKVEVWVKRDDLCHPAISGNKFRKLKYNLLKAEELNKQSILSFGGAYSNHIYALAAAAKIFNFKSIGIIRGEELNETSSPTLRYAHKQGMKFHFVSRASYRNKSNLAEKFGRGHFIVPEGGSNQEALPGCAEMMQEVLDKIKPSHICLAAGTGGTTAGILSNTNYAGETFCFPVLKNGEFLANEIENLLGMAPKNLKLYTAYHFGGYAKINEELLQFMEAFKNQFGIPLDRVYTAKLFYGVLDLINKNEFKAGSKIVIYHSGGLQGNMSITELDQKQL